jgi:hypothetical protein
MFDPLNPSLAPFRVFWEAVKLDATGTISVGVVMAPDGRAINPPVLSPGRKGRIFTSIHFVTHLNVLSGH